MFNFLEFLDQFNDITLVYSGGEAPHAPSLKQIIQKGQFHIAADHGITVCNSVGIKPDVLIGDFDSLETTYLTDNPDIKLVQFPTDKDFTDTELAIHYASTINKNSVILIGGGGNQLDHFLANIQLVFRNPCIKLWITAREVIIPVQNELFIKNAKNLRSSIYSNCDTIVSSEGLGWELQQFPIHPTQMSVSNYCKDNLVKITVVKGRALILLYPDFLTDNQLDFTYV